MAAPALVSLDSPDAPVFGTKQPGAAGRAYSSIMGGTFSQHPYSHKHGHNNNNDNNNDNNNEGTKTFEFGKLRPSIPFPPSQLTCTIKARGSRSTNTTLLAVSLRASSDPGVSDQVAFDLMLPATENVRRPLLGVTAPVSPQGIAEVTLNSVESDGDLESLTGLAVVARAKALVPTEGHPGAWSAANLSHNVSCTLLYTGNEPAVVRPARSGTNASHWITVYRYSTGETFPDYLDEHNAGDIIVAGRVAQKANSEGIWARYCVEVLNASLDNITTHDKNGSISGSPYADYLTCYKGGCHCPGAWDRIIGRLPKSKVFCKGGCCSPQSTYQSSWYVGKMPVKLPWLSTPHFPQAYLPWDGKNEGAFYSFPSAGRCPPGISPGDRNCTWRREASYALTAGGKFDKRATQKNGQTILSTKTIMGNAKTLAEQFARAPLRLPPCR
eukprot:CAMPEP_0206482976 /NCGR_PEP_ID=MMETSP0324_2-20121206/39163_1 /ASSEMBLY_ACC=CAM_ASM_000836 /TAXON_ID=2866 /ORGANISM="Crypthecodinium cohnii, Strain Seligo" /LENGTH=440 /DNA_ID=CAMNT_0053960963 /DNA_START=218 /DNA_END=1541 /DNA_ORIENTATION=+